MHSRIFHAIFAFDFLSPSSCLFTIHYITSGINIISFNYLKMHRNTNRKTNPPIGTMVQLIHLYCKPNGLALHATFQFVFSTIDSTFILPSILRKFKPKMSYDQLFIFTQKLNFFYLNSTNASDLNSLVILKIFQ